MSHIATTSTFEPKSPYIRAKNPSGTEPDAVLTSTNIKGPVVQKVPVPLAPPSSYITRLLPPVGQFFINLLLQIAGFVAAIAFGIYAVQSVTVAKDANQSAEISNQLAIIGICLSSENQTDIASICSRVVYNAATVLPSIASTLFPSLANVPTSSPTQTGNSNSTSTSSSMATATHGPNGSVGRAGAPGVASLVGIIIGAVVGGLLVLVAIVWYFKRRSRRRNHASKYANAAHSEVKSAEVHHPWSIVQSFKRLFVETRVITEPR